MKSNIIEAFKNVNQSEKISLTAQKYIGSLYLDYFIS